MEVDCIIKQCGLVETPYMEISDKIGDIPDGHIPVLRDPNKDNTFDGIRAGDLVIMSDGLMDKYLGPEVTYFSGLNTSLVNIEPRAFSITNMHVAHCLSYNGSVLDIGSADGPLSLLALRRGADHAYAIDLDIQALQLMFLHMQANGIGPDKFDRIKDSFMKKDDIMSVDTSNIKSLFITIGSQYKYGDRPDLVLLQYIRELPNVGQLIVGGYIDTFQEDMSIHRYEEAARFLDNAGYKITNYVRTVKSHCVPGISNTHTPALTLVLNKK